MKLIITFAVEQIARMVLSLTAPLFAEIKTQEVMLRRGNGLKPQGNAIRCVCFVHFFSENDATALRLKFLFLLVPRVAEAATLGWRPSPRWGIDEIPTAK